MLALLVTLGVAACEQDDTHDRASDDPTTLPPFRLPSGPPRLVVRGDRACVVSRNATARCWGAGATGPNAPAPFGGADVLQVSLGDGQHCVLLRGGRVSCASAPTDGMPARATPTLDTLADVVQLAGVERHTCALRHDGSVWCWGDGVALGAGPGERLRPRALTGLPPIKKVVASGQHTCALAREGSVFCWGRARGGALGDAADHDRASAVRAGGVSGAIDVAVGDDVSCALGANGAVRCWGAGPLAAGPDGAASRTPQVVTTVPAAMGLAVGPGRLCVLRQGGTVVCGTPKDGLDPVEGLTNVEEVGIGTAYSCALAQGGAVWCWTGDTPPARVPGT